MKFDGRTSDCSFSLVSFLVGDLAAVAIAIISSLILPPILGARC